MESKTTKTKIKMLKDMVKEIRNDVDNLETEISENTASDSIKIDKTEFKQQYFHENYMKKEVLKVKLDVKQLKEQETKLPKKLLVNKRFISNYIKDAGKYIPLKKIKSLRLRGVVK